MGDVVENPAGRLFEILSTAKTAQDNLPIKQVWANTFEIDQNDTGALLLNVAEIINLVHLTKGEIQKLDGIDHKIYLRPFAKIERAFATTNLEAPWQAFKNHLDDATMVALQFCSDTLARQIGENKISKEELDTLLQEVDMLLSKILESGLPEEIKSFLVNNLENIRRSIITYRIRGASSLKHVLEGNIGSIYFHREQLEEAVKNEDNKEIFPKFFTVIDKLSRLVSFALSVKKLSAPIAHLLLGNEPSS